MFLLGAPVSEAGAGSAEGLGGEVSAGAGESAAWIWTGRWVACLTKARWPWNKGSGLVGRLPVTKERFVVEQGNCSSGGFLEHLEWERKKRPGKASSDRQELQLFDATSTLNKQGKP